ncbi:MAG: enoyl-CoA hydratase/isomerase family protein [Syntrophales bacterium]|nr:enoyl-CoA hydratase/isomerase family protein [Syntrophales bacterium]
MAIVEWKKEGSVAMLIMNNGENRFNPAFNSAMLNTFDEIEADHEVHSVIISSSDTKNWSLGIDLNWMMEHIQIRDEKGIKDFIYGANDVFKRILLFPMPVIAAINGHAFGDGSILACACDFRFMKSDRGFFCFPEVDIDIPFLPSMLAQISKAFPTYKMEEAIFTGKRMVAKELEESKVIVKACQDASELMTEALAFAASFQKKRGIFGELKKRMNHHIVELMKKADPPYIENLHFPT